MVELRKNWPIALYAALVVVIFMTAEAMRLPLWAVLVAAAAGALMLGWALRYRGFRS